MSYGTKYQKELSTTVNVTIHDVVIPMQVNGKSVKTEMDARAYEKMMHWVDRAGTHEVSGLGMVEMQNGIFRVSEVFLLPQENGATSTDIEPEDMARLMFQTKDLPGMLRFWWHSHVQMEAYWSGTDIATMKELAKGGWFLSMVVNQKRARRTAFLSVSPELFIDEITADIVAPNNGELIAEWNKEYDSKVKKKTYTPQYPKSTAWAGRKTPQEREEIATKRKANGGSTNGGTAANRSGHEYQPVTCTKTGLQEFGRYQFYIEGIDGLEDSEGVATAYLTATDIYDGSKTVWYKPKSWKGGSYIRAELTIEQLGQLAMDYVKSMTDQEAKIVFDDEMSQAQLELLPDWDKYEYWDEIDGNRAEELYSAGRSESAKVIHLGGGDK